MTYAHIIISNCKQCVFYSSINLCTSKSAVCEKIGKRIQTEVIKGKKIKIPEWCPNKLDNLNLKNKDYERNS